jgi:hypothetical protein
MLHWWKLERALATAWKKFASVYRRQTAGPQSEKCLAWREELEQLDSVAALLKQLPTPSMPADLPLRIRHRISQEQSRSQRPGWGWRWANQVSPFALPAAAGLLSAVLIFGAFIRIFEIPVQANSQLNQADVPIGLRTAPRLRSIGPIEFDRAMQCMVVEILIDQDGRVADFHILRGSQTPEQLRHLENMLLFTVFDPATVFGKPTSDTVFWFSPCERAI